MAADSEDICDKNRRRNLCLIVSIRYLVKAVGQAVTQHGYAISGADLFDVAPHDDVAEFLVQLHGIADTTGLFAGNEGRAGTAEGVEDKAAGHGGIHDRISCFIPPGKSDADFLARKDEIIAWLNPDIGLCELILDKEPNRVYRATDSSVTPTVKSIALSTPGESAFKKLTIQARSRWR